MSLTLQQIQMKKKNNSKNYKDNEYNEDYEIIPYLCFTCSLILLFVVLGLFFGNHSLKYIIISSIFSIIFFAAGLITIKLFSKKK
jgi:L-asparagine transporter-like permease